MDDKAKLKCVLKLLKQTININKIMGSDNLSQLFTWVDVDYVVRPDMKSNIGVGVSFGCGLVHCKCIQKNEHEKFY